ncbi:hypothetical protein EUX98_g299 [Antrodiella citrinella]|uniref:5'-Nucleotidase C-terminal domain-containing protein n=1 Tax=Antrodiella citrinella TaxID=2447956 RepID=A0A4V3XJP0_9APHY|nr:hypothetical protein EUX98_g299 [Antrodiella citrinella]
MASLPILHFNDVYRVQPFKLTPASKDTIDVTQFAVMLNDARDQWPTQGDGGLVLFSGDVFSPSTESSVTRGSHMPWLLSNVVDTTTGRVPEPLREFEVLERAGVRVGIIGIIEKEWIGTISSWPSTFKYKDVAEVGHDLSRRLRDPNGEYKCDIIIALTHARIPNDIQFAKALAAHSPAVQESKSTATMHGVDIILGGHDHLYYISKGVTSWDGYDVNEHVLGAEQDEGDILIVKSGTDFRDLSEFVLELQDTPEGSVRNKLIKGIRGSITLGDILEILPFQDPIVVIELDGEALWTALESAFSTWPAQEGRFPIVSGFRVSWDSRRPAGQRVLGVWLVSEPSGSVSSTPAHSGTSTPASMSVSSLSALSDTSMPPTPQKLTDIWEVRKEKGGRMYKIVTREYMANGHDGFETLMGQKYLVDDESGQMMSTLVRKYLLGMQITYITSTIADFAIALGCRFVNSLARAGSFSQVELLHADSKAAITRERARQDRYSKSIAGKWRLAVNRALRWSHAHYRDHFSVAGREHMSPVDCFPGEKARKIWAYSEDEDEKVEDDKQDNGSDSLVVIHPMVDGRLQDEGRK